MRIALVIERFDPARGGRERSTAEIAAGLSRRGHEVTVLCREAAPGQATFEVRALAAGGWGRTGKLSGFVEAVGKAAREEGFDVVHATLPVPGAQAYQPRGGLVPAQAAVSLRRRRGWRRAATVLTQPLNLHRRRMAQLEREVVGDPSVLCLPVSEMVARELLNYYARSSGVRVVFNAVDTPDVPHRQREQWRGEYRDRIGAGANSPVFLTVARNFALKGVAETIEAFARWARAAEAPSGARLVVVGQEKAGSYRHLAAARDVAERVRLLPPSEEVFPWYAAADALVLLSWYDPCSRVVLEATRWGIPSITTAYNGAAEVLAGGAGIVVNSPRHIDAVVAAMAELADPKRRAERCEACRKVADSLAIDRHVDELLAAYEEHLGKR